MSHEPLEPPTELQADAINTLNGCSPGCLDDVAQYAEKLAEHKNREKRVEEESDKDETDEPQADLLDDVPSKATITIKEINDNRYYYWQWRDGEQIHSQYKSPVSPDE